MEFFEIFARCNHGVEGLFPVRSIDRIAVLSGLTDTPTAFPENNVGNVVTTVMAWPYVMEVVIRRARPE